MPDNGYWTTFAAPSTVDWCEPNYVHAALVAEWWNSLSSLPIAALGLAALVWSRASPWREARRFTGASVVLTAVGVGSAAFHATLTRVGQALDELPMVYAGLTFLYVVLNRTGRGRGQWGLAAFAGAFTVGYVSLERWFVFFVAAYAGLVALLVVRTAVVSFGRAGSPVHRGLFWLSAGSYVGGVVLLWIPEHVLLPCDHPLQAAQLHAWFHLTSAVGSYAWLAWAAYDWVTVTGRAVHAEGARPLWPPRLL